MNAVLLGAINGIATAAKTAKDADTISLCEHMMQMAEFGFGTTYDSATSVATPLVVKFPNYPAGDNLTSYDSMSQLAGNIRANGG